MYTSISSFLQGWEQEAKETIKVMEQLTDASLATEVAPGHRTLGRIAWHLATTIPELTNQIGTGITVIKREDPVPTSAAAIAKGYAEASNQLLAVVKTWNDAKLQEVDTLYGSEKWPKGLSLHILVVHQAHHRGQMTVLMRQAGLNVPGVYGPSKDEWTTHGMTPPEV